MVKKRVKKTIKTKKFKRSNLVNKITMVTSLLVGVIGLGMILSNISITGNAISDSIKNTSSLIGIILLVTGLVSFFMANREGKLEKMVESKDYNLEEKKVGEYEKICGWNVSKEIPEKLRNMFRKEMEAIDKGEMTDRFLMMNYWFGREYEQGKSIDECLKIAKEKETKIYNEWKKEYELNAYIEHVLEGSSFKLFPDPFISIPSYFVGEKIDLQKKIIDKINKKKYVLVNEEYDMLKRYPERNFPFIEDLEQGLVKTYNKYLFDSRMFKADIDSRFKKEDIKVNLTINYKTREAWIDPA